ncbi:MAG: sensor histidine kinase [Bacteroidota bacterium]
MPNRPTKLLLLKVCLPAFMLFSGSAYPQQVRNQEQNIDAQLERAKDLVFTDAKLSGKIADSVIVLAKKQNKPLIEAVAWNLKGIVMSFIGTPDSALYYYAQSEKIGLRTGDKKTIAKALQNKNLPLAKTGKYSEALSTLLKALKLYKELDYKEAEASCLGDIGNILIRSEKPADAIRYLLEALDIADVIKNESIKSNFYNSLAVAYVEVNKLQEAKDTYVKALSLAIKLNRVLNQITININLGDMTWLITKKAGPSLPYFLKAEQLAIPYGDETKLGIIYQALGEIYAASGSSKKAMVYALKAKEIALKSKDIETQEKTFLSLAKFSSKAGDFKQAYSALTLKDSLSRILFDKAATQNLNELQTKYETEKKQAQISLLGKQNQLQKLQLVNRNIIIAVAFGLLILLFFIGLLVYNRYKLKQERKLQDERIRQREEASRAVIEAEENERKRIAGELHDGLGQLFSAVKMNLSSISESLTYADEHTRLLFEKTMSMVDESCTEVREISHQMAPNVLLRSGLTAAVRDFIGKIDARKIKINLETFGLQQRLDQNTEMILYRVIQESVNNVIKHSEANVLDIQLAKDEEGINAMIEDNGKGFNLSDINDMDGMGLKNMISRVSFLKGSVDFSSTPGQGTLVAIHIPA